MPLTGELKQIDELRLAQRYSEAQPLIEEYVRRHPDDPDGHNVFGIILREIRDPRGSVTAIERALGLQDRPDFRSNLAMSLLHLGVWERGWTDYEARFAAGVELNRAPGVPDWDGKVRLGLRLLLVQEQGQGDTVHFIRYARMLAEAGVRVSLWSSPSLAPLMHAAGAGLALESVVSGKLDHAPFDAQAPVMSLPRILRVYDPIPPNLRFPYLADIGDFPAALPGPDCGRRRVVIAWACTQTSPDYPVRSCPVELLTPLAARGDLLLLSVQRHLMSESDAHWIDRHGVVDLRAHLNDFRCTAAAIRAADGVVTVDTSVAHIAGALAVPTIVMLRYGADWRWHDDDRMSRWYPTVQIVRQENPNDWADVVRRVGELVDQEPFRTPTRA